MPNYNAQVPPYSIFPGDVAFAFNAEAPAAGQPAIRFAELRRLPGERAHHPLANHLWLCAVSGQHRAAVRAHRFRRAICDDRHLVSDIR